VKHPIKSYRIFHSPRVGSTLLCQLLQDTGLAGKPGEHFSPHGASSLCEKYGVDSYEALRSKVFSLGMDNNRIFGAKLAADENIVAELCKLKGISIPANHEEVWSDFFPNCKNIIIIRRNKLKQIASWWKAIKDEQWHLKDKEDYKVGKEFYKDKYDENALTHLFHEANLRDIANGEYLDKNGLSSKTVVYEDLVAAPERVVNNVLRYLELSISDIKIPLPKYKKTSNAINEIWVKRYAEHLQSNWDKKVWNP